DDVAFLARRARLEFARGTVGGGGKGLVATAAAAAVGDVHLVAWLLEIAQHVAAVAIDDQRSRRGGDDQIAGPPALAIVWLAVAAIIGAPVLAVDNVGEAVGAGHGADDHAAGVAAVTAIGAALGDVFFATKARRAPAAVTALDIQNNTI